MRLKAHGELRGFNDVELEKERSATRVLAEELNTSVSASRAGNIHTYGFHCVNMDPDEA